MKVYHSYWSSGWAGKPSPFVIDLHRLSAFLAKKHYGEVHLVTDSEGAESLSHLGYTSVSTELDALPKEYHHVWSLGKIWVYKKAAAEGVPFMHIDYDVLLWKPLPVDFTNSPVFVERIEHGVNSLYNVPVFYDNCPKLHDLEGCRDLDYAINAGIVGGTNTAFIGEAYSRAWDFVMDSENKSFMTANEVINAPTWLRATVAEQLYFYRYAERRNQFLTPLLTKPWHTEKNQQADELGYTHLWGAKTFPDIQKRILAKCKEFGLPTASDPHDTKWAVKGVKSLVKALALPDTEKSNARLEICKSCQEWTGSRCKICGCFTSLKVRIEKEHCPIGKW